MKVAKTIYQQGARRWIAIVRDPERPNYLIDTNEYVVVDGGHALLCDPGGLEVFPAVFGAISSEVDPSRIEAIFSSHQDPDVISSLALWLEFNPRMKCYVSWLWGGFIPHFGGTASTFVTMPDGGMEVPVGGSRLIAVPAHYLHSSGNFHLYDANAKILFSGDVGAALLPPGTDGLFVENFDQHIKFAEAFHRRWMGSEKAKRDWCERVSKLEIDMLCPQHGAIYRGEDVARFINWFDELEIGCLKID
ncbi:MAG: MBL fold metallo-hydrolase [Rhodocyclaceae bacterium]|nr:MBL fold metallo-hydrolase [Rhodocyclaceae bacterium]MBX3668006.1 MBL fold metallo-hydrolase [Rhodocyclaceae bacterium]